MVKPDHSVFEVRRAKALEEVDKILKKYKCTMGAQLAYHPNGLIAEIVVIDAAKPADKKSQN